VQRRKLSAAGARLVGDPLSAWPMALKICAATPARLVLLSDELV
jgi:hypothetical protein